MLRSLPLALGAGLALAAAAQEAEPRHVLFLFADDLRPDAIAAHGNLAIDTPALDRLAGAGFSFRANYCMGSRHGAVCAPSRAMLMSGRTLHRVRDDLAGVTTLPELLRAAGFATFATGKWHNGRPAFERSFEYGRTVFFGGMCDHHSVPAVDLDPETRGFGEPRREGGHSSARFADAAIEFLRDHRARSDARRFFCYVAFTAPHDPRDPPAELRDHYADRRPPLPPNFRPQHGWNIDEQTLTLRDEVLAGWPREPEVIRDQLAEYYALVTDLDRQLARVLAALEETGYAEDTLVVFAADHGLALGSHGLLGKQNLYEHSMGCPLILAGPGIEPGETRSLTYLLDLYPTLCAALGVEPPDDVEGRDLLPVARGERAGVRDSLFTLYRDNQRAVRDERWKLIRLTKTNKTLLFDLAADPYELQDLAGAPEHETEMARLTALLERWQAETGDEQPLTAETPLPLRIDLTGRARKPDRWQPEWIREKYFDGGR